MEISVQSQIQWCSLRRILTFGQGMEQASRTEGPSSLPGLSRFDESHWPQRLLFVWKASFSLSIPQLYCIRIEYLHPPFGAGNLCLQIGRPQRLASLVFLGRSFVPRSALIRMFGLEYVNIFACLSISTLSFCCFAFGRGDSNWNYKYQGL